MNRTRVLFETIIFFGALVEGMIDIWMIIMINHYTRAWFEGLEDWDDEHQRYIYD
jgi:hypothetical protein